MYMCLQVQCLCGLQWSEVMNANGECFITCETAVPTLNGQQLAVPVWAVVISTHSVASHPSVHLKGLHVTTSEGAACTLCCCSGDTGNPQRTGLVVSHFRSFERETECHCWYVMPMCEMGCSSVPTGRYSHPRKVPVHNTKSHRPCDPYSTHSAPCLIHLVILAIHNPSQGSNLGRDPWFRNPRVRRRPF
jgi:hypothetical protein